MKKKGYAKGGAMKKKGYAKGGAMKKKPVAMKKGSKLEMKKDLHPNLSNPNAGSGKNKDGIPLSQIGKPMFREKIGKPMFRELTASERADKRREQRKKSGQLDQAKKKARETAVKAMGGGMMKKGMAKGGVMKKQLGGKMKSKGGAKGGVARGSGAARPQKFTRNG